MLITFTHALALSFCQFGEFSLHSFVLQVQFSSVHIPLEVIHAAHLHFGLHFLHGSNLAHVGLNCRGAEHFVDLCEGRFIVHRVDEQFEGLQVSGGHAACAHCRAAHHHLLVADEVFDDHDFAIRVASFGFEVTDDQAHTADLDQVWRVSHFGREFEVKVARAEDLSSVDDNNQLALWKQAAQNCEMLDWLLVFLPRRFLQKDEWYPPWFYLLMQRRKKARGDALKKQLGICQTVATLDDLDINSQENYEVPSNLQGKTCFQLIKELEQCISSKSHSKECLPIVNCVKQECQKN